MFCDFDTQKCDYDTYELWIKHAQEWSLHEVCDFDTYECDFDT
jgi:hypothetical protein